MTLTELRVLIADKLTGLDPEWVVIPGPSDVITPPAYLLDWGDVLGGIWLLPNTFCTMNAQMEVVIIAERLEPTPGFETLEAMVAAAATALSSCGVVQVLSPAPFVVGGVQHLAARLLLRQTVDIPGR